MTDGRHLKNCEIWYFHNRLYDFDKIFHDYAYFSPATLLTLSVLLAIQPLTQNVSCSVKYEIISKVYLHKLK